MARHLARRGGIWWTRLVVPERLRPVVGRREFIQSCRTADIRIAKTVAAMLIAEWRQSLLRVELAGMDSQALKLLKPAPSLALGGTITLAEAQANGVDASQILKIAATGKLKLYCRLHGVAGHLLNPHLLDDDPLTGGKDLPVSGYMPQDAIETVQSGVFAIPDARHFANALLVEGAEGMAEVEAVEISPECWFLPEKTVRISVGALEVSANGVSIVRTHLIHKLPQDEIDRELAIRNASSGHRVEDFGPRAEVVFSVAVGAYCTDPDGLPQRLASAIEIGQRKNSMLLMHLAN
jgi:hypothetical protein